MILLSQIPNMEEMFSGVLDTDGHYNGVSSFTNTLIHFKLCHGLAMFRET